MRAYLIDQRGRSPEREDALPTRPAACASQALEASHAAVPRPKPQTWSPWT